MPSLERCMCAWMHVCMDAWSHTHLRGCMVHGQPGVVHKGLRPCCRRGVLKHHERPRRVRERLQGANVAMVNQQRARDLNTADKP